MATSGRPTWPWVRLPPSPGTNRGCRRPPSPAPTSRSQRSSTPDARWGAAPADALPSYDAHAAPAVGFTEPVGQVTAATGAGAAVTLGVQAAGHGAVTVDWTAQPAPGVTVSPPSGQLVLPATAPGGRTARATEAIKVTATAPGTLGFALTTSAGAALPPLALDMTPG